MIAIARRAKDRAWEREEDQMTKNNGRFLSTSIILLTFAHLFNDFYAGFLIPLLSYFQASLHLTITQVSVLPTVLAV
ncbi:MAG: hypothetical protein ACE5H1_00230, partial [Thermodesulfobacteriota bacterium]